MRFVIVTGMSGAGKRTVIKILEDSGFFCVDNLPVMLITKFYKLADNSMGDIDRVALGVDVRSGDGLDDIAEILKDIKTMGGKYEILFMEAGDTTLIKRFKQERRTHPLIPHGRVEEGIEQERKKLSYLKKQADYIIDTDNLLVRDLRSAIENIFVDNKTYNSLYINVVSFGFKHGIPADADLVFDVRFMPNPYYDDSLRHKTGNDKEVQDFVMSADASAEFLSKLKDMVSFLIPNYIAEGKNQLVIAIGCTGGHHRSVTVANKLYEELNGKGEYGIRITHRDIDR